MPEPENQTRLASGADLSGKQLGDYSVLRRLGRGAMAEVYLAEQRSLGRQVALKVLRSDLASDPTCVQRFQREARAAASLIHANIVQVHEVACIDGFHLIAQEYVQGANLQQYLARNGTLDLKLALLVLRQVAAALAKAADQKIVHRDIKPENIMLTKAGEVKVADFGLARVLQLEGSVQLTQAGVTMGTPLYMSPEQAEGKTLDHRSDIYSLGVACYHMLAGHPPFTGDTPLAVAVQHLKTSPEPLENIRPDLPPALARIVHKMMAKSPDHRHQSARELVRELRPLLQEHLDEELGDDLPGLDTAGLDMLATSIHAATQRLDVVMKASTESRTRRLWQFAYGLCVLAAFAVGGWIAQAVVMERSLLEGVDEQTRPIGDMGSAEKQVEFAVMMEKIDPQKAEEAWRSVITWYRDKEYAVGQARTKLAWIYLNSNETDKALEEFKQLVIVGSAEPLFVASGLAGQYLIYEQRSDQQGMGNVFPELVPVLDELRGGPFEDLRARLEQVLKSGSQSDLERRPITPPQEGSSENVPRAGGAQLTRRKVAGKSNVSSHYATTIVAHAPIV